MPATVTFDVTSTWTPITIDLASVGAQLHDVTGLIIGVSSRPGESTLLLDDVRLD